MARRAALSTGGERTSQSEELVADAVGRDGELDFNTSAPDGTARKLLDGFALVELGWRAPMAPRQTVEDAYWRFLENHEVAPSV